MQNVNNNANILFHNIDNFNSYRKQTVVMTTNITPSSMKRKFQIYPDVPLNKYLELYEQVFDIDLYAYRVSFLHEKQHIMRLDEIKQKMKDEKDKEIEVQLVVESVGG